MTKHDYDDSKYKSDAEQKISAGELVEFFTITREEWRDQLSEYELVPAHVGPVTLIEPHWQEVIGRANALVMADASTLIAQKPSGKTDGVQAKVDISDALDIGPAGNGLSNPPQIDPILGPPKKDGSRDVKGITIRDGRKETDIKVEDAEDGSRRFRLRSGECWRRLLEPRFHKDFTCVDSKSTKEIPYPAAEIVFFIQIRAQQEVSISFSAEAALGFNFLGSGITDKVKVEAKAAVRSHQGVTGNISFTVQVITTELSNSRTCYSFGWVVDCETQTNFRMVIWKRKTTTSTRSSRLQFRQNLPNGAQENTPRIAFSVPL